MMVELATYAMTVILVVAVGMELRTGRIPNWLTLLPLILFVAILAMTPERTELLWQLGMAAIVFGFGLLLFFFAGFGAGAVKLISGLALFIPPGTGLSALAVFIVVMFVSAFLIVQIRKAFGSEDSKWFVMAKAVLPMSVPIAAAGLAAFFIL